MRQRTWSALIQVIKNKYKKKSYVRPFPVDTNCSYNYGQSYGPILAQTNFHCATTLNCHYIHYGALILEPCSCPGCCIYTYMAPNTPTILPYSTCFKPTFMWFMVGAGVIGRPFLSFLDGTPHKQAWWLFYTLHEIQQHFVVSHG